MRPRVWPGGVVGRLALVLILANSLQFLASTLFFEQAELVSVDDAEAVRAADALETAARVIEAAPRTERAATARLLTRPPVHIEWRAAVAPEVGELAPRFRAKLIQEDPGLAGRDVKVHAPSDASGPYRGSLALADGSQLVFALPQPSGAIPAFWSKLASVAILSGCILAAALVVVRALVTPLRILARAANAIGHGPPVYLDEAGPREVRRVTQAFNAMQTRIETLIRDRTEALAAVSHDLRTPIARMHLRCDCLENEADKSALMADLDEMRDMIAALMAFLGGDTDPERPRLTDIAVTLETLVDAASDAGKAATYAGPARHSLLVRPLATKRAFANIINNALTYGGRANVALRPGTPTMITVEDDGPGIPVEEHAAVFEPFCRLDAARTAGSGGLGLGLAIVRQAVAREGGAVDLANRPEGGLRVTITLPGG